MSEITNSMVKVFSVYNSYDYYRPWQMKGQRQSTGSGCIIEGNRILTNAHVVADQTFIQVQRAGETEKFVANLEVVAHECDLAILQVDDDSFFEGAVPVNIGDLPRIGDKVSVFGFPQGGSKLAITEGIVSRVENLTYAHSWAVLLCCQTDAPINPGSSGGPVIRGDKIVGIAFQSGEGQNVGYLVPPPVIEHFLAGNRDGIYVGVPALGLEYQNMENSGMRKKFGLSHDQSGVLVSKVFPGAPCHGKIFSQEVILRIDSSVIANDGTVEFREGERTLLEYAAQRRQIGDKISIAVLREGKSVDVEVELSARWNSLDLVPRLRYETPPSYFVFGGLVFSPVTTNLLLEWETIEKAPREIASAYFKDPDEDRRQLITIIQILPDEINVGYDQLVYSIVNQVNGKKVADMKELVQAIEGHAGEYLEILTDQDRSLVLVTDEVRESNQRILDCYRVPSDRSDDLK